MNASTRASQAPPADIPPAGIPIDDGPCGAWKRAHSPLTDSETLVDADSNGDELSTTVGQKVADYVAATVGSWPFILGLSALVAGWIAVNVWLLTHPGALKAWDPYPFILLNLVFSIQSAYTGPVVMMSQNRQDARDRRLAERDLAVNRRAEAEIAVIMEHLLHQDRQIDALRAEIAHLTEQLRR